MAAADPQETISVEVAYALPARQTLLALEVPRGTTAGEAVEASGVRSRHPELAGTELVLGVFGERVGADHVLEPGDRVEIYRPLQLDPREARRQRARHGRTMRDAPEEGGG